MSEAAISDIEQWAALVSELQSLDGDTFAFVAPLNAQERRRTWVPADHDAPLLFQKELLPLLLSNKIEAHDTLIRSSYPWLLEFDGPIPNDYPQAFRQFQHNSEDMLKIMFAYGSLVELVKAKRTLATGLRGIIEVWITRYQSDLNASAPTTDVAAPRGSMDAFVTRRQTTVEATVPVNGPAPVNSHEPVDALADSKKAIFGQFNSLKSTREDNDLVQQFSAFDLVTVYTEFVAIWRNGWYPTCKDTDIRQNILAKFYHFTSVLPPATPVERRTSFKHCLSTIRSKTLARLSESKEQSLNATIDILRREKGDLENRIRRYDRAISDLGFRHLTEQLPWYAGFNGTTATAMWQSFWSAAWYNGGRGPKKGSPLRTIWDNADPRGRSTISDAGSKLFNVLSSNIHGFGGLFDPQDSQRDKAQGDILKALKPDPTNVRSDEVLWNNEVKRFV